MNNVYIYLYLIKEMKGDWKFPSVLSEFWSFGILLLPSSCCFETFSLSGRGDVVNQTDFLVKLPRHPTPAIGSE